MFCKVYIMTNYKTLKQFTILCLLSACLFTGCSKSNSTETSENNKINATEEVSPTPVVTMDPEIRTENIMGIYIGKQEAQIGLGLDTTSIKEVLGKADDVTKNKKEKSQTWYYKDLDTTITFEKSNDIYTISSIKGGKKANTLKTGGGITAGSSREDIVKAYKEQLGEDADTGKDKIVIDNMGYSQIVFTIENDVVVGITMELL